MSSKQDIETFLLEKVMSRFSIENSFPQSTDKFRRVTLLCSTRTLVPKKIKDTSKGRREGGRQVGIIEFFCQNFCLRVPKSFVEDTFCVRQKFWKRKR